MGRTTTTDSLVRQLDAIESYSTELESRFADALDRVHPEFQAGARNLIAYVAMRNVDVRDMQGQLARRGLSSLGRAEKNVLATIRAVRGALCKIEYDEACDIEAQCDSFEQSRERLRRHIDDILGPVNDGRDTRIMVTLPADAATDPQLVGDLVLSGMDIARINCAHDDEESWRRAAANVDRAVCDAGRNCRIVMDLAGPKLRTGEIRPGPGVVRLRPRHDAQGRVIAPCIVRFVADSEFRPTDKKNTIPVPQNCIDNARVGDWIRFRDTRGKKRELEVVKRDKRSLTLECGKTSYLGSGTKIRLRSGKSGKSLTYRVGELPPTDNPIVLKEGDTLILHRKARPGEPARIDKDGAVLAPAHVSCRQPEVFEDLSRGDPVLFNDGKIEGSVDKVDPDQLAITVTRAKATGSPLRGDKGINFPKSDIKLQGLTETDRNNLSFVVDHADAVSMSFVRKPADIVALQSAIAEQSTRPIGIIVKIETRKAFRDLPRLLLTAMCHYPAAVMIARGDLAVECGWERLAEIQEEILWMCEAAEMPVIWATQVLERETKTGRPSRAEITDAAMSQRADCVMLNKGPHIRDAIRMLDDILRRMQAHQHKKSPKLRKLSISDV